jgi:phosphoglycolate phosphatase
MEISAVIFDCDGTLLSSQGAVLVAARRLVEEITKKPVSEEEILKAYTPDMAAFAAHFNIPLESPEQILETMKLWQKILHTTPATVQAFAGIEDLLVKLQDYQVELYVWTARDRRSTTRLLKELDLLKYFLDMRCLDDTDPKPSPKGIAELVAHLPNKDKIYVIGDSFTDIKGAKLYGAHALGAIWEASSRPQSLLQEGAEKLFKTPKEFSDYICPLLRLKKE